MAEMFQIAQRLIKWDTDFPVNCWNGYAGLKELDRIIADAKVALTKAGLPFVDDLGDVEPEQPVAAPADQIIGQIEGLFPNWRSYRDLVDCIECTLHELRQRAEGHA